MKPRLKLHYRTASQAQAEAVASRVAAVLTGREFDRPRRLETFFDPELREWVVSADIRYDDVLVRDDMAVQLKRLLTVDVITKDTTKDPSFVSVHNSHHDEGKGGAFDTPSLVTQTKASLR